MCTNEKVKQTFLQHLPVPVQQVVKSFKVVIILAFICWKQTHMQISYKPVVQACDDLKFWCTPHQDNK